MWLDANDLALCMFHISSVLVQGVQKAYAHTDVQREGADSANSQNKNLKWASVWRAKCVEPLSKMIGFMRFLVRRTARIRRTGT